MIRAGQLESASAPLGISAGRALVVILMFSSALRVASSLYQGNTVADLPGVFDQISYHELAQRVAEGHGFSFATGHWPATRAGEPTAHWSYAYTLYLAAIYKVFGAQPLLARLVQAIIAGVLHPWLAWRIGGRVFGSRAGLVAAGLSAAYAYFFYYAGGLVTEAFYIIAVLWTLDVALRLAASNREMPARGEPRPARWRLWLELGLALGAAALLRQVFLLFAPFLFLWLYWHLRAVPARSVTRLSGPMAPGWQALRGLAVASIVLTLLIAPWTLRNLRAFGAFVPLNTNAGYAFFWANHPIYGTEYVGLLPPDGPSYYDLIPKELRSLNEAELDRALLKRGLEFVVDDPARFILLSLSRTKEYFRFWPSSESGTVSNLSRVGSFGVCLPFMLYGLWRSAVLVRGRWESQQIAQLALLYGFVVVYTAVHLASWALIRYRLPVDAVLLVFAGFGLADLAERCLPSLRRRPASG